MTTVRMIAPALGAGVNVTAPSGANYVSDANGIVSVALSDVNILEGAGFLPIPGTTVISLPLSTAGSIVQGAINIIGSSAASTASYAYTLAAPLALGVKTTIMQPSGSTAATTVTASSLCNINLTNTGATILTFTAGGSVDLISVGSTLYQIVNRTPSQSSAGAALVFQPASS